MTDALCQGGMCAESPTREQSEARHLWMELGMRPVCCSSYPRMETCALRGVSSLSSWEVFGSLAFLLRVWLIDGCLTPGSTC